MTSPTWPIALKDRWIVDILLLAVIVSAGLFVRLEYLTGQSLWYDESLSYHCLDEPTLSVFFSEEQRLDPTMAPLYFVLEYWWAQVVGITPYRIRMLSVGMGMGVVVLMYFWGRQLGGRIGAAAVSSCTALSIIQIYYSQEIRMYILLYLLLAGSLWALTNALRTGRWAWWMVHALCNLLLPWTHLFSIFPLFAEALFLAVYSFRHVRPRQFIIWVCAQVPNALAITFLWVIRIDMDRVKACSHWSQSINHAWSKLIHDMALSTGGGLRTYSFSFAGVDSLWIFGVMFTAIVVLAGLGVMRLRENPPSSWGAFDVFLLLIVMLAVPPLVLFGVSRTVMPLYHVRYILFESLLWYAFVGLLIGCIPRRWGMAVAIGVIGVFLVQYVHFPQPFRPDWAAAGHWVCERHQGDEKVYVEPGYNCVAVLAQSPLSMEELRSLKSFSEDIGAFSESAVYLMVNNGYRGKYDAPVAELKAKGFTVEEQWFGDYPLNMVGVYRIGHPGPRR